MSGHSNCGCESTLKQHLSAEQLHLGPVCDSTVVGIGEATHGTVEFRTFRYQLTEHLIRNHGLRNIAIELNITDALILNQYVRGDRRVETVKRYVSFWPYETVGFTDFVDWLKSYSDGEPVNLIGIDAQCGDYAIPMLRDRLESHLDSDTIQAFDYLEGNLPLQGITTPELRDNIRAVSSRAVQLVESDARTDDWEILQLVVAIEQHMKLILSYRDEIDSSPNEVRERAMFENLVRQCRYHDADSFCLWAHNGHVKKGTFQRNQFGNSETLGQKLANRFGDAYHAIGTGFDHGEFNALPQSDPVDTDNVRPFVIEAEDSKSSLRGTFSDGETPALLHLNGRKADAITPDDEYTTMHNVGATFDSSRPDCSTKRVDLGDVYDSVYYVPESNSTNLVD